MTTIMNRWTKISLILGAFIITVAVNGTAQAEDTHAGYGIEQPQYNAKPHANAQSYDQQYKIPRSYNGTYYPDDDNNSMIGYHGTSNSASNQNQQTPYYYYY